LFFFLSDLTYFSFFPSLFCPFPAQACIQTHFSLSLVPACSCHAVIFLCLDEMFCARVDTKMPFYIFAKMQNFAKCRVFWRNCVLAKIYIFVKIGQTFTFSQKSSNSFCKIQQFFFILPRAFHRVLRKSRKFFRKRIFSRKFASLLSSKYLSQKLALYFTCFWYVFLFCNKRRKSQHL
jgi:hypothetical protein